MILKALYDYYQRRGDLAPVGKEYNEISFVIVIDRAGNYKRIEDTRNEDGKGRGYLVSASWARSGSTPQPFNLWDNCAYVLGISQETFDIIDGDFSEKKKEIDKILKKNKRNHEGFVSYVKNLSMNHPENEYVAAVMGFYNQYPDLISILKQDPNWLQLQKNLTKNISFAIDGDTTIVASQLSVMALSTRMQQDDTQKSICLVTGDYGTPSNTFSKIKLGKQSATKLISFQRNSGYDSYGKSQGLNAPISIDVEFMLSASLRALTAYDSKNKFYVANRVFVFWASSKSDASIEMEKSFFSFFGQTDKSDDPNENIMKVREVFNAIYSGKLTCCLDDRFYILGIFPANKARIAISYWVETPIKDFAGKILQHFDDMEIIDTRSKSKHPYMGLRDMLNAVTLDGKSDNVIHSLPDAVVKSIFQGLPYPHTLFSSVIRRIRAEQDITPYGSPCRVAVIKAYLNRLNDNNKKITIMLDKENCNQGYLCGRLFAVLCKIQDDTYHANSIQERYMNAASSTPSAVFATILNLSSHHAEKLNDGTRVFYEKIKQEIVEKLPADGFPSHLNLQDQGRFFVGFYHQRQDFFRGKKEDDKME